MGTYGTTAVIRSTRPRSEGGSGSSRSPRIASTPFRRAQAIATGSMSVPTTVALDVTEEHRRHGPAPGAEVDGDPVRRQELDRPSGERLGVRTRHEHAGVDPDPNAAEGHRPGDPRERLPLQAPCDQVIERSGAFTGRGEECVGLGAGSEETSLLQLMEDVQTLLGCRGRSQPRAYDASRIDRTERPRRAPRR